MTAKDYQQTDWDADVEDDCRQLVRLAVREDLEREQDWTTIALVDPDLEGRADITPRRPGVVCGLQAAAVVLDEMEANVRLETFADDGDEASPGAAIGSLSGGVRDLLTCERIVLNVIGRLSGVATLTRAYVEQAKQGGNARVYDTRKTTPGWRRLEKFAVRRGGGRNHRLGLFDGILIKDNHLAAGNRDHGPWSPAEAVRTARKFATEVKTRRKLLIEIEVDTLEQLQIVLPEQPDIVLLDNMSLDELRAAVDFRNQLAPTVELEASGGVTLETIADISSTGVDRISVGALTHSAASLDVGLDWHPSTER